MDAEGRWKIAGFKPHIHGSLLAAQHWSCSWTKSWTKAAAMPTGKVTDTEREHEAERYKHGHEQPSGNKTSESSKGRGRGNVKDMHPLGLRCGLICKSFKV